MTQIILSLKDQAAALVVSSALIMDRIQDTTLPAEARDQLQYVFDTLQEMRANIQKQQQPKVILE